MHLSVENAEEIQNVIAEISLLIRLCIYACCCVNIVMNILQYVTYDLLRGLSGFFTTLFSGHLNHKFILMIPVFFILQHQSNAISHLLHLPLALGLTYSILQVINAHGLQKNI